MKSSYAPLNANRWSTSPSSKWRSTASRSKGGQGPGSDADIVAHFRDGGKGWQTRLNAALRQIVDS